MTNKRLREALLKRRGFTSQALYYHVNRLKSKIPMKTEDAIYVIAQNSGIILDRYLDTDTIDKVRSIQRDLAASTTKTTRSPGRHSTKKETATTQHRTVVISGIVTLTDPVLSDKKVSEAKQMAKIYPALYVLENSIREVIDRVMTHKYGNNWWDSEAPQGLKEQGTKRMTDDKRNAWHQRRGARPIDYLNLDQLKPLMRKIKNEFVPNIIPDIEWFDNLVNEVYKSRCVLCHMNPLDRNNIQAVKVRFKHWQKQMVAKLRKIPNILP